MVSTLLYVLCPTLRRMLQPSFRALLAKLDITGTFLFIHVIGMRWQDKEIPAFLLGCAQLPKSLMQWNEGLSFIEFITHYVDDFLFGGRQLREESAYVQSARLSCNDRAQVRHWSFRATNPMEIRLPDVNLQQLKHLLRS